MMECIVDLSGVKRFFKTSAVVFVVFIMFFSGCVTQSGIEEAKRLKLVETSYVKTDGDKHLLLPDWEDGEYHDYYGTMTKLSNLEMKYPHLTNLFSIGKSVEGRDIWCFRITNEGNRGIKYSCLIDGCIHGCEWEAGEACLYLAEYLLINFGRNQSVSDILNVSQIYIIPIVNPDGRQKDERWNFNGIDLNRNYDVDFGRLLGGVIPLGVLFGRFKIPIIRLPLIGHLKIGYLKNCGRHPFSEPETRAIRDMMKDIYDERFSFYLNCHTATHSIIAPWLVYKPPFEITDQEKQVLDYVGKWVEENTEYGYLRKENDQCSGNAMDWFFYKYHIPSFTFELLSKDYEPWIHGGKHDHLVHWMKTTLPVFLYFLVNIKNLCRWETPDAEAYLPEGVPPPPLE